MKASLALLLIAIPAALSIQCYHETLTDSEQEPRQTKICAPRVMGCIKKRFDGENELAFRVEYDCARLVQEQEECMEGDEDGRSFTRCYCEGELCNASERSQAWMVGTIVAAIMAKVVY